MIKEIVLVIAAHPDDEILGCGGAIAQHKERGDFVYLLTMTDGVSSRVEDLNALSRRRDELKNSCAVLGIDDYLSLDFPDNSMDSVPLLTIVKEIEYVIAKYKPTIIYTHYLHDLNIDHSLTSKAVRVAARPLPGSKLKQILMMEIASSTEWTFDQQNSFLPNYFISLSKRQLSKKLEALGKYTSELRDAPHPRSEINLNSIVQTRGAQCGFAYAEAFMLLRYTKS